MSARFQGVTGLGHEEFLKDLAQRLVCAIGVIQGPWGPAAGQIIRKHRVPVVWNLPPACVGLSPRAGHQWGVGHDPAETMRRAIRHLLELGCRKIAWLGWLGPSGSHRETNPAYQAFRALLTEHGLPARKQWIRGDLHPTLPGAGYAEFREMWSAESEKPDGLLVTDDVLFQDVVTAILELRIPVPDQLKVVATANKGAVTCPSFPAARIEHDPDAQAQAMGEMLLKLAGGEPVEPPQVCLPFRWATADQSSPALSREPAAVYQPRET